MLNDSTSKSNRYTLTIGVFYRCIQKNGVTTGYFNRGLGDMVDVGQIKASVGTDRANIRYADVCSEDLLVK